MCEQIGELALALPRGGLDPGGDIRVRPSTVPPRSVPYATSRVRTCLKRNSRSPAILDPSCESTSSRSSSRPSASSAAPFPSSRSRATEPFQNTRPTTDADRSALRSKAGSRSMRAASTACTVSGMTISPTSSVALQRPPSRTIRPSSMRWRMISSRKSGFPSARARIDSRVSSGRSSTARSTSMRVVASLCDSGSRKIELKLRFPPPQPVRRWARSGREGQTKRSGPATRSASSSSRSSNGSSAQWMSSMTTMAGRSAARPVKNALQASWVSSRTWRGGRTARPNRSSSSPNVNARTAAERAGSGTAARTSSSRAAILASAASGGSESSTPVYVLSTSPSGQ